jgi:hypothetical protein
MRVLFYGGCHAAAFRKIFDRFAIGVEHVDHLTNFRLIRANEPMPYEKIKAAGFDWIIFNPIRNKESYNTSHLEEFCRRNGIRFLRFPWLQWEGYFPTMKKAAPSWYSGWWCSGLDDLAEKSSSFEEFRDAVLYGKALASEAVKHIEVTTEFMRRLEEGADLKVLPYILENYQTERLFLTPDHATTRLYQFLVRRIAEAIGCQIDESFYYSTTEIQAGISLPVLPSVGRALGLNFAAADFSNNLILGSSTLPLADYLKLHFYKGDIRLATARHTTRLRAGAASVTMKEKDRLLIRRGGEKAPGGYGLHEVLSVIHAAPRTQLALSRPRQMAFYPSHWAFSMSAKPEADLDEKTDIAA